MEHPRVDIVGKDPIKGTDDVRYIMGYFCPHCDERLNVTQKEPSWVRECPECDYWWCEDLYDAEYE